MREPFPPSAAQDPPRVDAAAALLGAALASAAGSADPMSHRDDLSEEDRRRVRMVTAQVTDFSRPEPYERMAGGAATSLASVNANAFSHPSANLAFEGRRDFALGNGLFRKVWVSAPSSTRASDGLGRCSARAPVSAAISRMAAGTRRATPVKPRRRW